MPESLCIAMTCDGEPVVRCVVGRYRRLLYLLNPDVVGMPGPRSKGAVGFPQQFVYAYEKSLFDGLSDAYNAGDKHRLGTLWKNAAPYSSAV